MRLELEATLRGHSGVVWSVAWSPRGILASCGADRSVRVWAKTSTGWELITTLGPESFRRTVRHLTWGADGRSLATACFDGVATVLELVGGEKPVLEPVVALEGHESETKCVAYSSEAGLLATCSRDRSVWIWEVGLDFDYECIAVLSGHSADVKFVTWHPKCELLVSCSYDNTIRVWVEDEDDWFCSETLAAHDTTVWAASFDHDGTHLGTVDADGTLIVWKREAPPASVIGGHPTFKVIARNEEVHEGAIYSIDWNKFNGLIATGGGDDSIRLLKSKSLSTVKSSNDIVSSEEHGENEKPKQDAGIRLPQGRPRTDVDDVRSTNSATNESGGSEAEKIELSRMGEEKHGEPKNPEIGSTETTRAEAWGIKDTTKNSDSVQQKPESNGPEADADTSDTMASTKDTFSSTSFMVETLEEVTCSVRAHSGDVNHVAWHPTDPFLLASCGDDGLVRLWRVVQDDAAVS